MNEVEQIDPRVRLEAALGENVGNLKLGINITDYQTWAGLQTIKQ